MASGAIPTFEDFKKTQSPPSFEEYKASTSGPVAGSIVVPPGLQNDPSEDSSIGGGGNEPGIPAIVHQGIRQLAGAIPSFSNSIARGTSDTLEGLVKTLSPLALPAVITAPGATALAAGAGALGQGTGQFISDIAGASPDTSRAIGDVTGLASGYLGSTPAASRVVSSPDVWESMGNMIPFLKAGTRFRDLGGRIMDSIMPPVSPPVAPTPFRPNPNTARKMQYGGSTEDTSQAFPSIPSIRTGWTPPSGTMAPGPEPIVPIAPTPYQPKKLNMPKYGGASGGDYSNTPNNRIWNKKAGIQPTQPEVSSPPAPQPKPVTVTPEESAKDPAQVKAYNKVINLVKKGKDSDLSMNLLRSLSDKRYGTKDPSELDIKSLNEIYDQLKGKK